MIYKVKHEITTRELQDPLVYRGLYSRVAKRLGISRQAVSQVVKGKRATPRIQLAIKREIERIQRERAA